MKGQPPSDVVTKNAGATQKNRFFSGQSTARSARKLRFDEPDARRRLASPEAADGS
jgi:hypothetical protein